MEDALVLCCARRGKGSNASLKSLNPRKLNKDKEAVRPLCKTRRPDFRPLEALSPLVVWAKLLRIARHSLTHNLHKDLGSNLLILP